MTDRSSEERSRTWTPLVEVIRREMLARFSDKLSMEEIASCAYAVAAPLFTPTAEDSRVAEALRDVLAICESRASEFWEAYIRTILRRISILSGVPSEATPSKENAPTRTLAERGLTLEPELAVRAIYEPAPVPEGVQGKEPTMKGSAWSYAPFPERGITIPCDGEQDCPMFSEPTDPPRHYHGPAKTAPVPEPQTPEEFKKWYLELDDRDEMPEYKIDAARLSWEVGFRTGKVSGEAAGRRSAITEMEKWEKAPHCKF